MPLLQVLARQLMQADLRGEQRQVVAVGLLQVQPDQHPRLGRQQPLGRVLRGVELGELPIGSAQQQGAGERAPWRGECTRESRSSDAGKEGRGRVAPGFVAEDQQHLAAIPADPQRSTPPPR